MPQLRVGLLGATGFVGQHYLKKLAQHPFFKLTFVSASEKNVGKNLKEHLTQKPLVSLNSLSHLPSLTLDSSNEIEKAWTHCDLIFSALPTKAAKEYEPLYAEKGLAVISNASAFRNDPDIPIFIPEINLDHLKILDVQKKKRGWKGLLLTKSNCSLIGYLLALYPLHQKYKIKKLLVTNLQSISGAGYPGLSALDIQNNVIPYIPLEEEKSEKECLKILGAIENQAIVPSDQIAISAHCNRVNTLKGHMSCVSVEFEVKPTEQEILSCWQNYSSPIDPWNLPTKPKKLFQYFEDPSRPQPRVDLNTENEMSISIGRLRPCSVLDYKFVTLSDNLMRGAALSGIYAAEVLYQMGYLKHQLKEKALV